MDGRGARSLTAVAAAALLLVAAAARLPAELRFSLEGGAGPALGRAAYDLSAEIGGDRVLSRLEFPLDGVRAAAELRCSVVRAGVELWRLQARGAYFLTDPRGLMRDYDWVKPAGFPPVPFSYTESSAQASGAEAGLQVSRTLLAGGLLRLYAGAGYRFAYLSESIRGFEGWQYLWNGTAGAYDLYLTRGSGEVLRYTLSSHALPLGVGLALGPIAGLRLALELAYLPLWVRDTDDHLLRNKLSNASGLGHGGQGRLEARFRPAGRKGRPGGPYLSAWIEGLGWLVSTTQRQEWYGDDPTGPGDETGTAVSGIGHRVSRLELRAGLGAGVGF